MKNKDIVALRDRGVLDMSAYCLDDNEAYAVCLFRKSLLDALDNITRLEMSMLAATGIEDVIDFNRRLDELQKKQVLSSAEKEEIAEMTRKMNKYISVRRQMLEAETDVYAPKLPFKSFRKLQSENRTGNILSGVIENILLDILYTAPENG